MSNMQHKNIGKMGSMNKQNRRNFIKTVCASTVGVLGIRHVSNRLPGTKEKFREVDIETVKEADFYTKHNLAG